MQTSPHKTLRSVTCAEPAGIRVSAVMPCLDEERTLATCIGKAVAAFAAMGVAGEVVVADNGSADRSIAVATSLGARVVNVAKRGYGAALSAGIEAARGEFVIIADADDSYDWSTLSAFVDKLEEGNDLVIGNRFLGGIEAGAMPALHRYLGNPLLSWLARTVHGAPIGDFHCGMRAFRRDAYPKIQMRTSGMEFATEMIVNAVNAGLAIAEIPTKLHRDGRDRPPHLRAFRDGWRHLRFILTYGPNTLYLAPGITCFGIGLALVVLLAAGPVTIFGRYFGIHFLALACALTLVGFNVIHYGVLAKVIALRRMPLQRDRLGRWALTGFSLERALLIGGGLILCGVVVDALLLVRWLTHGGSMESTVHVVFVATLGIVLGVNVCLGGFLLHLLVSEYGET